MIKLVVKAQKIYLRIRAIDYDDTAISQMQSLDYYGEAFRLAQNLAQWRVYLPVTLK